MFTIGEPDYPEQITETYLGLEKVYGVKLYVIGAPEGKVASLRVAFLGCAAQPSSST